MKYFNGLNIFFLFFRSRTYVFIRLWNNEMSFSLQKKLEFITLFYQLREPRRFFPAEKLEKITDYYSLTVVRIRRAPLVPQHLLGDSGLCRLVGDLHRLAPELAADLQVPGEGLAGGEEDVAGGGGDADLVLEK